MATGEGRARRLGALTGVRKAEPSRPEVQAVADVITPSAVRAAAARTGPRAIEGTRAGAEVVGLTVEAVAVAEEVAAAEGVAVAAAEAAVAAGRMAGAGSRIPHRDNIRR